MAGSLLFVALIILAFLLMILGATTFLWVPVLAVGLFAAFWVPIIAWARSLGGSSTEPTGVPTTGQASYEPVDENRTSS